MPPNEFIHKGIDAMIATNSAVRSAPQKGATEPVIQPGVAPVEEQQLLNVPTEFVGSFKSFNGGHVFIEKGNAQDYASMRASQLSALIQLQWLVNEAHGAGGSTLGKGANSDVLWLASSLAEELVFLIDLVDADAAPAGGQQ
jgi:hypothetical protein